MAASGLGCHPAGGSTASGSGTAPACGGRVAAISRLQRTAAGGYPAARVGVLAPEGPGRRS